jgi:hypothetical protein
VAALAVVVDTLSLQRVTDQIAKLDAKSLGDISVTAVNDVAERAFTESRKRMTERVNLTEQYVRERMDLEPANDSRKPEAVIVAFRAGGRKRVRPVNLRQYKPLYDFLPSQPNPTNAKTFTMRDGRLATNKGGGPNPRKPGSYLPFVMRTGNEVLNIPVGQRPGALSVEVLKGSRRKIAPKNGFGAFLQRMPSGEILVMRRTDKNGGKKGKGSIEALYSLSVWQLFRNVSAEVIPLVQDDLEKTVGDAVVASIEKAFT